MEGYREQETYKIIGICMEVHRILGQLLLEIVYKNALEIELKLNNISYEREKKNFRLIIKVRFCVVNLTPIFVKIIYNKSCKRILQRTYCTNFKLFEISRFRGWIIG